METLVLKGIITATSDKQPDKYKVNTPQKSAYLKLDEENTKKAQDFGLTEYGKDEKYFVVRMSKNITIKNVVDGVETKTVRSGVANETANFHSDDKTVAVAIIKTVANTGQVFYRLFAIFGNIVDVEGQDPFAEIDLTDIIDDLPF